MSNLIVEPFNYEGNLSLVVDSRLIAERLGIEHGPWVTNIVRKYQAEVEKAFGKVHFQNEKPLKGSTGGRPERFALLNEGQATFLMSLSRNTPEVIQCKLELVTAFSKAKARLREIEEPQQIRLRPPVERAESLTKSLEFAGIDPENPRFKQAIQDLYGDILGLSQPALPGTQEKWYGVAERAEQLGYKVSTVTKQRSALGKFCAKRGLERRQEFRLCNGTEREINVYRECEALDIAIELFFGGL